MPKRSLMVPYHKLILKIGAATLTVLLAQSAIAACPDIVGNNIESKVVGTSNGKKIYFCKQEFADQALAFKPSEAELITGGSKVISKGNTIQTFPLRNSIDLAGFNVGGLNFNSLTANYPNVNGQFGSPSLFNFYIKTNSLDDCGDKYSIIKNYLRNNSTIFQTIPTSGSAASDNSTETSIAKITSAKLKSVLDPTKEITADIYFYHANAGQNGQYFTVDGLGIRDRYCWFGVGTRLKINATQLNTNSANLKFAGGYKVGVGVLIN